MKTRFVRPTFNSLSATSRVAFLVAALLALGNVAVYARYDAKPAAGQEAPDAPKIPNDQLEALVAPIALYPYNPDRTWRATNDAW